MEFISDCESILTEDFAMKFKEIVTKESNLCDDKLKSQNIDSGDIFPESDDLEDQFPNNHNNSNNNPKFDNKLSTNRSIPEDSCNSSISVDMGNISNVQPIRRDIMNKFLSKYALDEKEMNHGRTPEAKKTFQRDSFNVTKRQCYNDCPKPKEELKLLKENIVKNDLANEIRNKSLKIQNEIHEERKRKLESIQERSSYNEQTPREKLDLKVKELDYLTDRMRQARSDRERITAELDQLKNKLQFQSNETRTDYKRSDINKAEVRTFQEILPMNQIQISQSQLTHLNYQLNQKKSQLKDLESKIRERLQEIENLEYIGLSRQEIKRVIEERNDLYEILRQSEENGHDRYELEKRLTEAKEDLSFEYKRSREKIMTLEEELDGCFKKITQLQNEKDKMSKELWTMKENVNQHQDNINELFQERNDLRNQVDKYKDELESERSTSRDILNQEKKRLESHIATEEAQSKVKQSELKNIIASMEMENQSAQEKISSLKSKVSQLENDYHKLQITFNQKENEYRENLQKTNEEKNQIIEKMKRDFYNNKENEIQTLKIEFDSEQVRTINNLRDCYKQQVADLQLRIDNKSQEIHDLRTDIRKMKQEFCEKEESLKAQFESETVRLKNDNRKVLESIDEKKNLQMEEIKTRYESLISKMKKEIDEERKMNERLRNAVDKANKDIAHESELVKKYKNEKVQSVNRVKELAKEKLQEEYKSIKQFYEKELEENLHIIEKTMQEKNSQLIEKCKEIKELQEEKSDDKLSFISNTNELLEIIKQHCSEMANAAKFILPHWKNIKLTENDNISPSIQSAAKNLQICYQEYSQYFHDLIEKQKLEKEKFIKDMETKNFKNVELIKEQILKDHAEEINSLNNCHRLEINELRIKHKEEIENMRTNVKAWKFKTAERLAHKLQKEFQKEIERKSCKSEMKISSSLSLNSFKNEKSVNNSNPIGLIEDLRGNIRQLREENLSLRKVILGKSSSNLQHQDDPNNFSSSGCYRPNENNSPVMMSSRPQSACHEKYRNRQNSKEAYIQRSSSFKNYS